MKRRRKQRQLASGLTHEEQEAYRDWFEREVIPERVAQERRRRIVAAEWQD